MSISDFQNPPDKWLWMTLNGHFKVTKVKIKRSVLTVASISNVPADKNVHRAHLINVGNAIFDRE